MCAGTACRTRRASRKRHSRRRTPSRRPPARHALGELEPLVQRGCRALRRHLFHVHERLGVRRPVGRRAFHPRTMSSARWSRNSRQRGCTRRLSRAATTNCSASRSVANGSARPITWSGSGSSASSASTHHAERALAADEPVHRIVRQRVADGVLLEPRPPQLDDRTVRQRDLERVHVRPRRAVAQAARARRVARHGAADRALLLARRIGGEQQPHAPHTRASARRRTPPARRARCALLDRVRSRGPSRAARARFPCR